MLLVCGMKNLATENHKSPQKIGYRDKGSSVNEYRVYSLVEFRKVNSVSGH